ncbi:hypothetical protein GOP47_0010029 [Adiantum capillus-veneris]|uniref:DJ-1/PfpI domain-containing protein n=1 Tax=Adiantum capillus-veneris TaxID=13818 RepID=A0A9D4UYA1_ADICA|nr:hypothetical protein GOP47_0009703 [Adiantum capillus-veneris]KAI5075953.1 hypothetical protein GOP47_0010029 [Adiantum capillus-veneris]
MAEGKVVVAIPLFYRFTALDGVGPYELLHMVPGVTVRFVSAQAGEAVTADNGMMHLLSTASFQDLPRPDIIVVPGGPGTSAALQDPVFMDWLKTAHETSSYTTSVCSGSLALAAAGLLQGLEATSHWSCYEDLAKLGAVPTDKRVVRQGKIITSAGVSSGIDMALHLITLFKGEEMAKMIQLLVEYDPQPPYDVGSPKKAGELLMEKTEVLCEIFENTLPPPK